MRKGLKKVSNMFKQIIKYILLIIIRILFSIFFNVKVKGRENLKLEKPYIIAPNHISALDVIFLRAFLLDQDIIYMTKEENVKMFLIGGILKYLFDLIPLKRDGRDSTGIRKAYEVLNEGGILRNISRRNKKRTFENRRVKNRKCHYRYKKRSTSNTSRTYL